jgi:hypothetical protein
VLGIDEVRRGSVAFAAAPAAGLYSDVATDLGEGWLASWTRWKWSTTRVACGSA